MGQANFSAYAEGINQGSLTLFCFGSFLFLDELIMNMLRGVTNFSLLYPAVPCLGLLPFLMVKLVLKPSSSGNDVNKSFMWCRIAWFQIVAPSALKQSWLVWFLLSMHE